MTSEQFVKQHYPNATVEKYKIGGFLAESFWIVIKEPDNDNWEGRFFSRSKSKSNAWVNARKEIQAEKGI